MSFIFFKYIYKKGEKSSLASISWTPPSCGRFQVVVVAGIMVESAWVGLHVGESLPGSERD